MLRKSERKQRLRAMTHRNMRLRGVDSFLSEGMCDAIGWSSQRCWNLRLEAAGDPESSLI